jgi:hypothetical protein
MAEMNPLRPRIIEEMKDASVKVDRCLRAGAMAMGAEVEINTISADARC